LLGDRFMQRLACFMVASLVGACGIGELEMGLRTGGDVEVLGQTIPHGDPAGDPMRPVSDPPTGDPAPGDPGIATGDPGFGDPGNPAGDPGSPAGDPAVGDPVDPGAVEINPGWLGGACASSSDCDDPNIASPTCETDGFPGGFCTQSCTQSATSAHWICPDTDYDGTLATMSRCIDGGGDPQCVSECDYALSATGCRPGYQCVERARYGDPSQSYPVCLPATGWPEPPAIGGPCVNGDDCVYGTCLRMQDGYCSKHNCTVSGCPQGSRCFTFGQAPDQQHFCLADCVTAADCRQEDNYLCDPDHTCWPAPPPAWDASVGSSDCATWWGDLSPCDSTPDQYIVVNKGARNIALCSHGDNVANYHGALGFSAMGDKNQEGDGKTPEGVFYVARLINPSQYHRAFRISYPDAADAARGVATGLINTSERNAIVAAQNACNEPPQNTELGSLIELHGESRTGASDWTWGCIATENANVDTMWATIGLRDTIVVVP
jgi:hypothetical protein